MRTVTPAEFARTMRKVVVAVEHQDAKAIRARAEVTQKFITAAAISSGGLGRKFAGPKRWVRAKQLPRDAALVNMRGGFAFLTEKGSWHYPQGWDMIPTNQSAMTIPYGSGFAAAVKHPAIKAHPFWEAGLRLSREPGYKAYRKSLRESIAKAVR